MTPDPRPPATEAFLSETMLRRLLGSMSVFILGMTLPQVLAIRVGREAPGVSERPRGRGRARLWMS